MFRTMRIVMSCQDKMAPGQGKGCKTGLFLHILLRKLATKSICIGENSWKQCFVSCRKEATDGKHVESTDSFLYFCQYNSFWDFLGYILSSEVVDSLTPKIMTAVLHGTWSFFLLHAHTIDKIHEGPAKLSNKCTIRTIYFPDLPSFRLA